MLTSPISVVFRSKMILVCCICLGSYTYVVSSTGKIRLRLVIKLLLVNDARDAYLYINSSSRKKIITS